MAWRPEGWDRISNKPAQPYEAGRDIWCRFCSYRNFEKGATAMLDSLRATGAKCTLEPGQPVAADCFGPTGTKGWLLFIPDKDS